MMMHEGENAVLGLAPQVACDMQVGVLAEMLGMQVKYFDVTPKVPPLTGVLCSLCLGCPASPQAVLPPYLAVSSHHAGMHAVSAALCGGVHCCVIDFDFGASVGVQMPMGNNAPVPTLEGLLGAADFVTLHVPLSEATTNMMRAERIAQMRKGRWVPQSPKLLVYGGVG